MKKILIQKGEIASTLAIFSLVLMTIGLLIGTRMVAQSERQTTKSFAFSTSQITKLDNNYANVTFSGIERYGESQWHLNGDLCFNFRPPLYGEYQLQMYIDLKSVEGRDNVVIGLNGAERILDSNSYYCSSQKMRRKKFSVRFNKNMSDIPADKRPAGVSKISKDDVEAVYVRISGVKGTWDNFPTDIAIIDHTDEQESSRLFVFEEPDPSISPRAKPNPPVPITIDPSNLPSIRRPVKVNVTFHNNFTGDFDLFDYFIGTCTASDDDFGKGTCDSVDSGNFKTPIQTIRKSSDTQDVTYTVDMQLHLGAHIIGIPYGYYSKYGTSDQKKDITGIRIEFKDGVCAKESHSSGISDCRYIVGMTNNKDLDIDIYLPDTTKKTFTLEYRKGDSSAAGYGSDTYPFCRVLNTPYGRGNFLPIPGCEYGFNENDKTLALTYSNYNNSTENIFWLLRRCNGTPTENNFDCKTDDIINQGIKTIYKEKDEVDLEINHSRSCTFKVSEFQDNMTEEALRGIMECSVLSPTPSGGGGGGGGGGQPTVSTAPTTSVAPTTSTSPTTPPEEEERSYYVSFNIINQTGKTLKNLKVTETYEPESTAPIVTTYLADDLITENYTDDIQMIKKPDHKLDVPDNATSYRLAASVSFNNYDGEIRFPSELTPNNMQNGIFRVVARLDSNGNIVIVGNGQTEFDATDVTDDNCINAADFGIVVGNYGIEASIDDLNKGDINMDGIVNSIDLVYVLENLNKGDGCGYNEPNNFMLQWFE